MRVSLHISYTCFLVSLCIPLSVASLRAAPPDEWHAAAGGGGVEYRWTHGFEGSCHIEFRDPAIKGTSRSTVINGTIIYDKTSLNGIEHDTIQSFFLTIDGHDTTTGPDVYCRQINGVTIVEFKRSDPPL